MLSSLSCCGCTVGGDGGGDGSGVVLMSRQLVILEPVPILTGTGSMRVRVWVQVNLAMGDLCDALTIVKT